MRNRTRVIAVAAVTAALVTGGTATGLAATAGAPPSARATSAPAGVRCAPDSDLAGLLGVPQARLDRALRAVKTSLAASDGKPTAAQFEAALARYLGVSRARVRRALDAGRACGLKPAGAKPGRAGSSAAPGSAALAAAVARELHVSPARVEAALQPLFAAGRADPSSPAFAAAARALGVSAGQLTTALVQAKQSLAGGS